jgi:hypothetical protein
MRIKGVRNMKTLFPKLLAVLLTIFCFVSFSMCQTPQSLSLQKINENKCSPILEGFQFCTTTPTISVGLDESVAVDISLQNMTDKNASIIHGNFYDYYKVIVKDSKGNEIPSFRQILLKRYNDKTITPEEMGQLLPINSIPRTVLLAPKEKYKVQFSFGQFYDLKTKGKYYIEMSRIIPKQAGVGLAELSFGTIEVEIK